MANNQNFSNLLLEIVENETPIAFELITPSGNATTTTTVTSPQKSSINHSPAENVNKLDNSGRLIMLLEDNIALLF